MGSETNKTYITCQYGDTCGGSNIPTHQALLAEATVTTRPRQSRPKPVDLIGTGMTSSPRLTVQHTVQYPYRRIETYEPSVCAGYPPKHTLIYVQEAAGNVAPHGWTVDFPPPEGWQTDLNNAVSNDAFADIGESLFEAKKTVEGLGAMADLLRRVRDTIRNPSKEVSQALARWARSQGGSARTKREKTVTLGDIAPAYLGVNWGIAPLASDIDAVVDRLGEYGQKARTNRIRSVSGGMSQPGDVWLHPSNNGTWLTTTAAAETNLRWKQYYVIRVGTGWSPYSRDGIGVGANSPASVGWALMPFSWLVDYFVDVSGWINAIGEHYWNPSAVFLGGYQTTQTIVTVTTTFKGGAYWGGQRQTVVTPLNPGFIRSVSRSRTVWHGGVAPSALPRWKGSHTWRQLVNTAAVLAGLQQSALEKVPVRSDKLGPRRRRR